MRTAFVVLLFCVCSTVAMEMFLTDAERNRESAAVFTGTVVSTSLVRELEVGGLWSAQVRLASVEIPHPDLKTNTVIIYEQIFIHEHDLRMHRRCCPPYPEIVVGQKVRLWCKRSTFEGLTNVFYVPSASWMKRL